MNLFKDLMDLDKIQDYVSMSTITLTCKIDTEFNVLNIFKFMPLVKDKIVTIKYGADKIRTLLPIKIRKSRKPVKQNKIFLNQVTIVIKTQQNRQLNIKLFRNGSLQITGCKGYDHFVNDITIMFCEIIKSIKFADTIVNFVRNPEKMNLQNINDFSIRMINCNFNSGFEIDRCLLYYCLKEHNINAIYDSCTHASVNIKYNNVNNMITSLFVFESGCVIITGITNLLQLVNAYNFMVEFVNENYGKIMKINIVDLL